MFYHPRITKAKLRTALVLLVVCLLGTNGMAATKNSTASVGISATTTESTGSQDPAMLQPSQAAPAPTPRVAVATSGDGMTQSQQGRQYGQPGFVGEPINLNVVNADIRDILNYVTEQYGVNFVIDSSVAAVPVTVNVQDVAWNVALEAVLKANRLGVEVSGNILRVATTAVLATESSVQKVLSDSRLDASPLVTEFIRLNYACGSAAICKAQSGDFKGGVTTFSNVYSPVAGVAQNQQKEVSTGGGGIQPIIQKRLSRRGSVEVDESTNTLIITDVKENIDTIRQLVALLDQPEPQVEIETRIVIASRSFSRDLGAQLSAGAVNASTGGLGNISTIPSALSGPVPGGVFGGLVGTTGPLGTLGAAANTVIGLTTGIFGTAQISAMITAAETKGTAKIVATPRVTTLNNRTAEISSGQQIPVTTGQSGGGDVLFTTTFVSVPLRLKVTPRITDAGTVILHVLAENNSVNTAIAINGTPGIDTQTMETYVLVPDGGTTIVGGVLGENESNNKVRTPGLANIPIIGNLFKRKTVTKQSSEILFFITPRIYRPDYNGRPTTAVIGSGNRTSTIAQPVPLGNPHSNTPTEQQQYQQQVPVSGVPATPLP